MPMGSARAATAQRVEQLSSLRCLAAGGRRRLSHCYNLTSCGRLSRKGMFSVQCNLPHILRQHTAQSNRLLYHLRPAACRRRLIISRRHHEITLAGDGTLRFLSPPPRCPQHPRPCSVRPVEAGGLAPARARRLSPWHSPPHPVEEHRASETEVFTQHGDRTSS